MGSAGFARLEDQVPMRPCQLHHSASVAKPYLAALVLRLWEDGLLDLDGRAADHLPPEIVEHVANADTATVRQLLGHRSGIPDFDSSLAAYRDLLNDPEALGDVREVLRRYAYDRPADFPAGQGYRYSDTNYALLGLVAEDAAGEDLGAAMARRVLVPLGLDRTVYRADPAYPNPDGLVNTYFEPFPGVVQNCSDADRSNVQSAHGHEGMIASVADFRRFADGLFGGALLRPASLAELLDARPTDGDYRYGLGVMAWDLPDGVAWGHDGSSLGAMVVVAREPGTGVTVVAAANLGGIFGNDLTDGFHDELRARVLPLALGARR